MKAQIGDYIETVNGLSKVVEVANDFGDLEEYVTANGELVCEAELGIDDIKLESEVEI